MSSPTRLKAVAISSLSPQHLAYTIPLPEVLDNDFLSLSLKSCGSVRTVSYTWWSVSWFTDCTFYFSWTLLIPTPHCWTGSRYSAQLDWYLEVTGKNSQGSEASAAWNHSMASPEAAALCDSGCGLSAECVAPGFESHCIFQPPGYEAVGSCSAILLVAAARLFAIPELNRFPFLKNPKFSYGH